MMWAAVDPTADTASVVAIIVVVAGVLFVSALGVAAVVCWVWALVHAIRHPQLDSNMKLLWVLLFLFTGFLGPLLYVFLRPKPATAVTPPTT